MTPHFSPAERLYRSFWGELRAVPTGHGARQARTIIGWLKAHKAQFLPEFLQTHEVFAKYTALNVDDYPADENALSQDKLENLHSLWSGKYLADILWGAQSCLEQLLICEADLGAPCPSCSHERYFEYRYSLTQQSVMIYCEFCQKGIDGGALIEGEFRIPTRQELRTSR